MEKLENSEDLLREECLVIILGYFSLVLYKNIHCGYSLEVHHPGTSNECLQHIFFMEK